MKIWVDADACPGQIRDVILRAAHRLSVHTVFVANKPVLLPQSIYFSTVQVSNAPDAADQYIVDNAQPGDLAVTQDIPLAAQLVPSGVIVISPRGDSYNHENVADLLARRNLMQELRDSGSVTGGPRPFDDTLKRQFANLLDAALHRLLRNSS